MEQITKLEEIAITQIAKDLRRTAGYLSIKSYQKENLENAINEVKRILKYMNELQDVLNK